MRRFICGICRHTQTALYSQVTEKFGRYVVQTRVVCECGAEWWE